MSVGAGEKRPRWGADERRGREGKERRRKEKENGGRSKHQNKQKRGREERESRERKDRGNKGSTERRQGKKERETGRTQISFSVCGSRRGRTSAATTKKRRAAPYPGDQRSEAVRTRTGAEAAQRVGSFSCVPGRARRLR